MILFIWLTSPEIELSLPISKPKYLFMMIKHNKNQNGKTRNKQNQEQNLKIGTPILRIFNIISCLADNRNQIKIGGAY
jgi:hypothetical protein